MTKVREDVRNHLAKDITDLRVFVGAKDSHNIVP
jgi:hypothetical protein